MSALNRAVGTISKVAENVGSAITSTQGDVEKAIGEAYKVVGVVEALLAAMNSVQRENHWYLGNEQSFVFSQEATLLTKNHKQPLVVTLWGRIRVQEWNE